MRVLTALLYLNTVPRGGHTVFKSGISVAPKKGRLVLWPSVLNDDPHGEDVMSHHEAKPVLEGEKFAANFWIHQYDFRGPHRKGCTM